MMQIRSIRWMGVFFALTIMYGLCNSAIYAEQVKDLPRPVGYVSDFAHVLSPDAVTRLESLCDQLDHSAANAQISVVTVHTLDGIDRADYANALENQWKIGPKGKDRGVLVLLAVDDRKYQIDVGYGLEGILPDGKVGGIGRSMIPDLRARDYDGAVRQTVEQLALVIASDAKVTLEDESIQRPVQSNPIPAKAILVIIVLLFYGGFMFLRMLLSLGTFGHKHRYIPWLGTGGPWINTGGSGFSGGGGGFSGFGGGSFGGGGAGGSW